MTKKLFKDLKILRRDFHQNYAELSTQEFRTCQKIFDYLIENTEAKILKVGGTGVMAIFEGAEKGKTIMLRADSDALPIIETNTFAHKSINPLVSHKCGHDGHTTILLGVAELLTRNPIKKGKIVLLWQPAEENGTGAKTVMADKSFKKLKIDQVFALHNLPGIPLHKVVYKTGAFSANVRSLIIHLKGKTAHAAEPEHGENQNEEKAVKLIKKSAEDLKLNHAKLATPFKWGEDFGLFTQKIPGAMFGIGSGENCPALHNPDYDFPDEITETAATLFYKILENAV